MEKKNMIQIVRSVKGTLMAHPDNEDNSEFSDRISSLEKLEQALDKSNVSDQRELLISFIDYLQENVFVHNYADKEDVDNFLKRNL
jgi:hypothetical protein